MTSALNFQTVLPSNQLSAPLRFLYGQPILPSADPQSRLEDEIEQYCALKQSEVIDQERIADSSVKLLEKALELKQEALVALDKTITTLQLLTQTTWGPSEQIRFLSLRAGAISKDRSIRLSHGKLIDDLKCSIRESSTVSELEMRSSESFANVIRDLRSRWPIEEVNGRMTLDLLPLQSIKKYASHYICGLFVGHEGVCVSVPYSISQMAKNRHKLTLYGFPNFNLDDSMISSSYLPVLTGRAMEIDQILIDLQRIAIDHYIFHQLKEEVKKVAYDKLKWAPLSDSESLISLVDLSGSVGAHARVVAVSLGIGDEDRNVNFVRNAALAQTADFSLLNAMLKF